MRAGASTLSPPPSPPPPRPPPPRPRQPPPATIRRPPPPRPPPPDTIIRDNYCRICTTFCVVGKAGSPYAPPAPTQATCSALAAAMNGISASVTGSSSLRYSCTNALATCPNVGGAGVQVCADGTTGANDVCNSFPYNTFTVFGSIGYSSYFSGLALNVVSTCGCIYNVFYTA